MTQVIQKGNTKPFVINESLAVVNDTAQASAFALNLQTLTLLSTTTNFLVCDKNITHLNKFVNTYLQKSYCVLLCP